MPLAKRTTMLNDWILTVKALILYGDTKGVRFWFSWATLGYGIDLWSRSVETSGVFRIIYSLSPRWFDPHVFWGMLFVMYALMLLKGLTGRYGLIHLLVEPVLGWAIWTIVCMAGLVLDGHPDASLGGALVATWLLIRYPTHWKVPHG